MTPKNQILELYADGMTFAKIAHKTGFSTNEIKNFVTTNPHYSWLKKCHRITRQTEKKSTPKWLQNRQKKRKNRQKQGLCVECGNPVNIMRKRNGVERIGYRCAACNRKRREKKRKIS